MRHQMTGHSTWFALAFSPDGSMLVSSSFTVDEQMPTAVCVWNVATGELYRTLAPPRNRV